MEYWEISEKCEQHMGLEGGFGDTQNIKPYNNETVGLICYNTLN